MRIKVFERVFRSTIPSALRERWLQWANRQNAMKYTSTSHRIDAFRSTLMSGCYDEDNLKTPGNTLRGA